MKGRVLSKKRPSVSKASTTEDESEEFKGRFSFKRTLSVSGPSHHDDNDETKGRFSFKNNKRSSMSPPKKSAGSPSPPRSVLDEAVDSDILALWEILGNTLIPLEKDLIESAKSAEAADQTTSRFAEMKRYIKQISAPEEELKESKPAKSKRQSFFASKADAARILESI